MYLHPQTELLVSDNDAGKQFFETRTKGQTMTEPERKKDGQLLIPFEKQLQLVIQFKEKQR